MPEAQRFARFGLYARYWLRGGMPWSPVRRLRNRIRALAWWRRPSEAAIEREVQWRVEHFGRQFEAHAAEMLGYSLTDFFVDQAEIARDEKKPKWVADIYTRAAGQVLIGQSKMRGDGALSRRRDMGSGRDVSRPRARESRPQRRAASSSSSSSSSGGGDPPDDPEPEPPLVRGPGVARGRLGVEEAA